MGDRQEESQLLRNSYLQWASSASSVPSVVGLLFLGSNGITPFAGFFDELKQFGAGVLRSDAGTNFFFSTV